MFKQIQVGTDEETQNFLPGNEHWEFLASPPPQKNLFLSFLIVLFYLAVSRGFYLWIY
jgi:hypothetical protein